MLETVINRLEKMLMGLEMHLASLLHLSFIRSVSYEILLCLWWYLKLVIIFLTFVTQITMVLKTSGNLSQRSACI
jgi:hypothetical protein